jgi:6-phosphofructokinase 1
MSVQIGILTAGGDSPGLNAAIRGIGKAAIRQHGMTVIGFRDGFKGLMQNRFIRFDAADLSGILTLGGTILGTSREKPHKMEVGGRRRDMTDLMMENYEHHQLEALVCLGGGGTQKNALRLAERGMNVVTLPKTIDNDVWGTDATFGYDTALGIATEAIDRLHSTAHSHHRIVVVEVMGHNTGWLALGAGLAGGADVILIPEIPYDVDAVAASILDRKAGGSTFSIVTVSEGAMSQREAAAMAAARHAAATTAGDEEDLARTQLGEFEKARKGHTARLAQRLEELTGLESRVTILGHVQRGGTPSPVDRLLATRLGSACARLVAEGARGVMVALRNDEVVPVPLEEVAGRRKTVPLDHAWLTAGRSLGLSFGD